MDQQSATAHIEPHTAPGPGRKFPCSGCGAGLEYSPGASSLQCPYCGNRQEIPQTIEQVNELCFHSYFQYVRTAPEILASAVSESRCGHCGAIVELPANVATEACTFCGKHMDNPVQSPQPMMAPQGVLPFRIELREAQVRFEHWVRSRWFAPNDLKKMARLGRLVGIYVPYWTYDSMTFSHYTGERGDYYWETVTNSKGERTQQRRTRWRSARGRVDHFFDDVLICASHGMPPHLVTALEPWDLGNMVDAAPDYLAGFRTERYQVDAEQGFTLAKSVMDSTIRQLVRQDIGGDEQRIHSVRTQYDGITFKHILLPVWLAAYDYHQKPYRVVINARSGEVQGDRPYSWIKITLFVLFLLAIAVPVALLIAKTQ